MLARKIWLCSLLLALPLLVAGAVYAGAKNHSYICPLTGEELRCSQCCRLNHSFCDQCDDGEEGQ